MGLPISKYTLLKAVAKDRDIFYGPYYTEKLNKFRSFKLYGIILHDPAYHNEFHTKLGREFGLLDRLTGQDFLFMGLADSPQEWVKNRQYFKEYQKVFDQEHSREIDYASEDPAITTFTLAKALNIDYDDLPVILLTDDLRKSNFHVVKTSEITLVEQLSKIGDYCSGTERPAMMTHPRPRNIRNTNSSRQLPLWEKYSEEQDPAFDNLLNDISGLKGIAINRIEKGLAAILSGVLSTVAAKTNVAGDQWEAKKHMESFINEYTSRRPESYIQTDIGVIENRLLALAGLLASLGENQNNDFGLTLHDQCENESHIIMRTFNKVAPSYRTLSGTASNNLDYSPLLICLGKVFEKELNLSVVHWIRNSLGIEMPDYFNKWKHTHQRYELTPSVEIVRNPEPVNFNERQDGKWRAPTVGASEYIFKSLVLERNAPVEITDPGPFLEKCRELRKLRNKTAHQDLVSEADYQNALKAFRYFIDNEKFAEMNSIKVRLRS